MKNLAQRYEPPSKRCCTAAEELVERIARMDNRRRELAYRRLTELLECANLPGAAASHSRPNPAANL
jgi:hypothetical protein